jgi:O-antigen ligase
MFSAQLHTRLHFLITCLIAFALPFKTIVPVLIALLLLNWLLEGDFKNKFRSMQHRIIFVLYIAFYLYHAIGLLWTSNMPAGLFDLEVKLSLFVFPWIFSTRPFDSIKLNRILLFFVWGCSLACIAILIRAVLYYFLTGANKFYYTELSYFMHPSYFSMYLNMSLLFLLLAFVAPGIRPNAFWLSLVPLHLLTIALLSSKIGLISLVLLLVVWLTWLIIRQRKYLLGGGLVLLLAASIFGLFHFSSTVSVRLRTAFHAVSSDSKDKGNAESTAVRMLIWGAASELVTEHPLTGAGTGDSKDALMGKYKAEGIEGAYEHNLNAHNAYLQILVALGAIGFLLLLSIQVLPFLVALKQHNAVFCGFILLMVFNFLPESMLETQAGSMYFGFFNSLLLFSAAPALSLLRPLKSWFTEGQDERKSVYL